jgi:hypothetical protein
MAATAGDWPTTRGPPAMVAAGFPFGNRNAVQMHQVASGDTDSRLVGMY